MTMALFNCQQFAKALDTVQCLIADLDVHSLWLWNVSMSVRYRKCTYLLLTCMIPLLQSRAAAAERRAADLDSQLLLLGRAMREAEGAALDWQAKAAKAEQARQELGHMVDGSEAAVKQVSVAVYLLLLLHGPGTADEGGMEQPGQKRQLPLHCLYSCIHINNCGLGFSIAILYGNHIPLLPCGFVILQLQSDLAQLQLSHSSERAGAQQQEQQLRSQLAQAQAAKSAAELKVLEVERQLAEARAKLDSQERMAVVLKQQLAEEGQRAASAADLQATVQVSWHGNAMETWPCTAPCWHVQPKFMCYRLLVTCKVVRNAAWYHGSCVCC